MPTSFVRYPITQRQEFYVDGKKMSDSGPVDRVGAYSFREEAHMRPTDGRFVPGTLKLTEMTASRAIQELCSRGELQISRTVGRFYYLNTYSGNFASAKQSTSSYPVLTEGDFLSDGDIALTAAFAKIGAAKFEAGVEGGELRETLKMLRRPLASLRDFLLKDGRRNLKILGEVIRRRQSPGMILSSTGKTVSDTWLELRYGLRPLINSIKGIIRLNLNDIKIDPSRIRTKGKTIKARRTRRLTSSLAIYDVTMNLALENECHAKIRGRVYFKQTANMSTARKLGAGLVNIPEVFWELTRCSFIADWFVNLGSYIASWRVTPEVQILGSTVSYRLSSTMKCSVTNRTIPSGWTVIQEDPYGSATVKAEYYRRYVKGVAPPGIPHFRSSPNLDWFKTVDLLLIILQGITLR